MIGPVMLPRDIETGQSVGTIRTAVDPDAPKPRVMTGPGYVTGAAARHPPNKLMGGRLKPITSSKAGGLIGNRQRRF